MPPNDQQLHPEPFSDLIYKSEQAFALLRWLRERRGLSQRALAALTGIAHSEIQRIESNQQECRVSSLVRICSALDVPAGWVLDVMVQSNIALFHRKVLNDPGFSVLIESLQIIDKTSEKAAASLLSQACILAAILLRVSAPLRRAAFHNYPTEDWRDRFLSFAQRLESNTKAHDRARSLRLLREQPVAQLQRLGLLSRSSLDPKEQGLGLSKMERRELSFGGELWSLTFKEIEFLWGLSPDDKKQSLTDTSEQPRSIGDVKIASQWPELKKRLQKATEEIGAKPALAKVLNVDPTQISQWLSESKSAREPGGDYALRLLKWVELQERHVK